MQFQQLDMIQSAQVKLFQPGKTSYQFPITHQVMLIPAPKTSQTLLDADTLKILVIDGRELSLHGTIGILKQQYPQAQIITAQTAQAAVNLMLEFEPNLVVMELFLAEKPGLLMQNRIGVKLLKDLMSNYPQLNICIHSTNMRNLVGVRTEEINAHQGGFVVADNSLSSQEILKRVNWALQGLTHTKDINKNLIGELHPACIDVLNLAFQEGLQDKAIAQRISVSERTVRHYWDKVQEALGIDAEELKKQGKNLRTITYIRAREAGLVD